MDIIQIFKSTELFSDLDDKVLQELADACQLQELKSGHALYHQGDEGDALYLIANGRLSVNVENPVSGEEDRIAELGRNEIVGELALITGEARSVTVRAVRDSGLLRISKQQFETLLVAHPASAQRVMRHIIERLRRPRKSRHREALRTGRTLAVVPAHEGLPQHEFTRGLIEALTEFGSSLRLDKSRVESALGEGYADTSFEDSLRNQSVYSWLNALEGQYRYVVYETDSRCGPWMRRCLRQADRILLLVDARRNAEQTEVIQTILENKIKAPIEVVLIHEGDYHDSTDPFAWRNLVNSQRHHQHVGGYKRADMAHIARMLSAHALGVVLGGGGARGFAHLGLLRALQEHNLKIDLIGGTSIGALISALVAKGLDFDEVQSVMRETFVTHNYLNDYSLSRVSLIRGKKLLGRLEEIFGDLCIEQLVTKFFCVSTNLTSDEMFVHERGLISDWVGASMSVPGIAPPFVFRGDLLVDGGLLNNLPVDVMAGYGRGMVLGCDVSSKTELRVEVLDPEEDRPYQLYRGRSESAKLNMFNILYQTATMSGEMARDSRLSCADIYMRMPVEDIGMFDWERMDEIQFRGYHYATEVLETEIAEGRIKPNEI